MVRIKYPEAVTWLFSTAVASLGLLCAAAWVYEKTRRRIEHPSLGTLTYQGESWAGLKAHFDSNYPAVQFEIPGNKEGPNEEECEKFLNFWTGIQGTIDQIRPHAIEAFQEIRDAYEDQPEAELVDNINSSLSEKVESFDKHWILSEVCQSLESESLVIWTLEFEVAWDIEHSRAAYLGAGKQVLSYNLSCAGSGLEDEGYL